MASFHLSQNFNEENFACRRRRREEGEADGDRRVRQLDRHRLALPLLDRRAAAAAPLQGRAARKHHSSDQPCELQSDFFGVTVTCAPFCIFTCTIIVACAGIDTCTGNVTLALPLALPLALVLTL